MPEPNLADLVMGDRLEALDEAWTARLDEPDNVDSCCQALRLLVERDMASRALPMASTMIDALAERGRFAEAAQVGMTLIRLEAHNDGLARKLFGLIGQQFGAKPWYPVMLELSGLREDAVTAAALETFTKIRRYTEGHVVYHRAGWGAGLVEHFVADRRELAIRFATGRVQEIPLATAIDSMTPLEDDDLRAMMLTAQDELARLADEDPAMLIRKAAKIFRGKVTSSEVKSTLTSGVIPAKKWAGFWKRAKAAAAVDPWLLLEGSTARPVFVLRSAPLSLADEAKRALKHCNDLGEEVAQIRRYLERSTDPEAQAAILGLAQDRIETAARTPHAAHAHILDGILLLEKHSRHPSRSAAAELRAMLAADGDDLRPEAFDLLATQDAREHAVGLLPEAYGEGWAQLCIDRLTRAPASVVEPIVDLLREHGQAARLVALWDQVAPYPQRHPILTYQLGRLAAEGAFEGQPGRPERLTVARVLLHLARVLTGQRRDPARARLLTRVTSLLAGRRNFLEKVLETAGPEDLSSFLGISERAGQDFPQEITDLILRAVASRYPELTAKPERPFWEEDAIFITQKGLEAKREEYRKLVDEQIPANSRAIGVAASHGDLSENSEWEAAVEEQRTLTTRAGMLKDELRKARLIEDQEIPAGVVAPGTAVTYTILDSGVQLTLRVLGPWDRTSDDVINYRAPLAEPLLGCGEGDTVMLPGDDHDLEVRVDKIERIV